MLSKLPRCLKLDLAVKELISISKTFGVFLLRLSAFKPVKLLPEVKDKLNIPLELLLKFIYWDIELPKTSTGSSISSKMKLSTIVKFESPTFKLSELPSLSKTVIKTA